MHATAAGRIQLALDKPRPPFSHLPSATDDVMASMSQLRALRLTFGAASKWAHALRAADRERLLHLSNPADPLTSLPSASKDAGGDEQGQPPRWAKLICAILAAEVTEAKHACKGREVVVDGPARPRQPAEG